MELFYLIVNNFKDLGQGKCTERCLHHQRNISQFFQTSTQWTEGNLSELVTLGPLSTCLEEIVIFSHPIHYYWTIKKT